MPAHYVAEATALFKAFAERHDLTFVKKEAPVELLWEFPVQTKLSLPVTLGLQNNDELNFGVDHFWSYFFPFPKSAAKFTQIIDAWVEGRARLVRKQRFMNWLSLTKLELKKGDTWMTVYRAYGERWTQSEMTIQNRVTK